MPKTFYSRIIMNFLTFQAVVFLYPEWKLFLYHSTNHFRLRQWLSVSSLSGRHFEDVISAHQVISPCS